jgi:predicted HTH transcriptional regulator
MANADGGALVIGVEDDGTVSGVDYPEDRLKPIRE